MKRKQCTALVYGNWRIQRPRQCSKPVAREGDPHYCWWHQPPTPT